MIIVLVTAVAVWLMINRGLGDTTTSSSEGIQPTLNTPALQIVSVLKNESVSFQSNRFPTGEQLSVIISNAAADGSDGIDVRTTMADVDGGVFATFLIPPEYQNIEE